MANIQNLKPRTTLTKEEAKTMGRNGGIASGKARRQKKWFKEEIERQIGGSIQDIINSAIKKAVKQGDIKAMEFLRDTLGETITNQLEINEVPTIKDDI